MPTRKPARLTPQIKRVLNRAIELVEAAWVQGSYLKDLDTGHTYTTGAVENGERFAVCAVGGLERAAWEELGKPDMSITFRASDERNAVYALVNAAQSRVDAHVVAANIVTDRDPDGRWEDKAADIISVNDLREDLYAPEESKALVLHFLRQAGKPLR
jgi:hypothetical protein